MEQPESPINRIGRTIWTVWGYLSGAVGRYLKPEVSNEANQNGEDTVTDVTVNKSYKELKENEEEKERSERSTWAQSESPQSGVRVRIAAVQWEMSSKCKGGAGRNTGTGVVWNTGVQEGSKEGVHRKAQEQRDAERTSDNNNKEVRTKSKNFVEEVFVDAPASISAGKGSQGFVDFKSVEAAIDAGRSENVINDSAVKTSDNKDYARQGVTCEEPTHKCEFEEKQNVREVLDKKEHKHAKNQSQNAEREDEQRMILRMTEEDEDESCTSRMADDLMFQSTYSAKQKEDLLKAPLHKQPKVDGKLGEEATESKSEREVVEAIDVETKRETEKNIKDEQYESIHDVEYESNIEEAQNKVAEGRVMTASELLEQPGTAQVENREGEKNKKIEQESEKEDTDDKMIPETLGMIKDEYHHEGRQLIVEKLNICESKQDEIQFGFTEGIEGIDKKIEPVCTVIECEATVTPESEPTKAINNSKQVTEGTVKEGQQPTDSKVSEINLDKSILDEAETNFTKEIAESQYEAEKEIWKIEPEPTTKIAGHEVRTPEREPISISKESVLVTMKNIEEEQHEAGLESSVFIGSEITNRLDSDELKLDETQTILTEETVETEWEPATRQIENFESFSKCTSNEPVISDLDESKQVTLGTIEDEQHEATQLSECKFAKTVDLCESKLDEPPIQFTEERGKTECDLLEEHVTGYMEVAEVHEKNININFQSAEKTEIEPVSTTEDLKPVTLETSEDKQQDTIQLDESKFAETVDLSESKLDQSPFQFTKGRETTECNLFEDPATVQVEVAEVHEKDLEAFSKNIENEAAPILERESTGVIEGSGQIIVETLKEGQHEAGMQSSEFIDFEIADKLDIFGSRLEETKTAFTEEMAKTECKLLEEPSKSIEMEENVIKQAKQVTMQTLDTEQEAKQSESKLAELLALCKPKVDEAQIQFTETRESTTCKLLEEPVTEHVEMLKKDLEPSSKGTENETAPTPVKLETEPVSTIGKSKPVTLETSEDKHQGAIQLNESKFAETVDQCESKLYQSPIQFTKGRETTECNLFDKPATVQVEVAEVHEKDLEAFSKNIENEAAPIIERDPNRVIEGSGQIIVETLKEGQQEAGMQSSEFIDSEIADKLDIFGSKLEETQTAFTEEMAKTGCEILEEPSKTTEMEENIIKQAEQVTLQTLEDTEQEGKQSESKVAEILELCKPKLDEAQIQFTEAIESTTCELLEEPLTEHVEVAEMLEKDLEPSSKGTENETAPTPDSEATEVFVVATTQEIVVAERSGQHAADQHLLGPFIGSDITEKVDSHLANKHETQSEFTEGMGETKYEPFSKMSFMKVTLNDESVDSGTNISAVVKEADQLDQTEKTKEAGTTSDEALKIEVEQLGDTICDTYGSQIPEVMIKQDSESVIMLVTEGPGNQSETAELQQKVRAEVAAGVLKQSAEMESVHEQPKSSENLALEEKMGQPILDQESLQIMSVDENVNIVQLPEEQISNRQRERREIESGSAERAEETADESVDEVPISLPQELDKPKDSVKMGVELLRGLTAETNTSFIAQKVEVLKVNTELTTVSDSVVTEAKSEKAEFETDTSKIENESILAAVKTSETIRRPGAFVPDETPGSQSLLNQGMWTCGHQDRSAVEPHGHQMAFSGKMSPEVESESALETSEVKKDSQKGGKDLENPGEAKSGLLDEKQVVMASCGVMQEVMRGLKHEFEEKQKAENKFSESEMDTQIKGLTKTWDELVETSDPYAISMILQKHSELSDSTVEDRQNSPVEGMDTCNKPKDKASQNAPGGDVELLAEGEEDLSVNAEKADGDEKSVVDSNGNMQERSRPGLKRVFEKMAWDEESKPTVPQDWAGTSLVLQQVSSLDCTVQKSKIAVKNPHVRPPKDPRTLINKASVEPLAPIRTSQPSPLRKVQGEGLVIPQKVQGIGFKLPGLGAGFPALRKTDAGRKIRDEEETESVSTQSLPVQKSDTTTETKEDCAKQEKLANKPKWTPPRHPGMGNPMMMSELKGKLKKTGKE